MYLGIQGMMPQDLCQVNDMVVSRIRQAGFSGVTCRFLNPMEVSTSDVNRLKAVLNAGGVQPAQANGQYEDLVNPHEPLRREGIRTMQVMCRIASRLGAGNLYVRPGSLNPNGSWYAHPKNRHPSTFERLVDSLKQVAAAAETEGIQLALEGHILSPLYNAERVKEVIEAVGSKALRFNMDPVNFIDSLPQAYDTTMVINHLFDVLGPYTICGHAKDFFVQDKLVLHLEETIIGQGLLDQETFLRRFEESCQNGYVLIEHLPDEQIPQAKAALDRVAQKAGLSWEQPQN